MCNIHRLVFNYLPFSSFRYWNQLNEDMRILLQRFDAETGDEEEKNEESEATTSFLTQLATWHKQELDEKLASRVQVSQRAVGKIIQVITKYSRLQVCLSSFPYHTVWVRA